jgi:hypothetical protein
MLKKFGINTTRAEKKGPQVKGAISERYGRMIVCACGKKFEKTCPSKDECDCSSFSCPYCGKELS